MLSELLLADAPTASGQNLLGRGNPMKNNGKVNNDNNGAEIKVAMPTIPMTTGKNMIDTSTIGIVDFLLCFLSDIDVTRSVKTKYNL
jgi:hypothetical protein